MATTYNWSVKSIGARKVFTDKNNITRNNAIKSVVLEYTGTDGQRTISELTTVNLSLVDLSTFTPVDSLTTQQVLQWALINLNVKEKDRIESSVKNKFETLSVNNLPIVNINLDE